MSGWSATPDGCDDPPVPLNGDRVVFEFDGRPCTRRDVVVGAAMSGEWDGFVDELSAGVVAVGHVVPDSGELRRRAAEFRRTRHLTAADDLRNWLRDRELTTGDLAAFVRRAAARDEAGPASRAPASCLRPLVWPEAVCSGAFSSWVEQLIDWHAAARLSTTAEPDQARAGEVVALGDDGVFPFPDLAASRVAELVTLEQQHRDVVERTSTDDRLESYIRAHRPELTRYEYDLMVLPSETAANEAAMSARWDHATPEEIAVLAGTASSRLRAFARDLPPGVALALAAAEPTIATPPVPLEDGWAVLWLRSAAPPSLHDPGVRAQAVAAVVGGVLRRVRAGRVRWCQAP